MASPTKIVNLPNSLFSRLKESHAKNGFDSVGKYASYLLEQSDFDGDDVKVVLRIPRQHLGSEQECKKYLISRMAYVFQQFFPDKEFTLD